MQRELFPHPQSAPSAPLKLWTTIDYAGAFGAQGSCNLFFGVGAPASRFIIPAPAEASRRDGLWQSTCFEAFVREEGATPYREYNFAPSGDWAAYDFEGRREGMAQAQLDHPPYIRFEDNLTWWGVGATFALPTGRRWRLGLSAVIEEIDGTKSYWALDHGDGAPDFHDPACFAVSLG